MESRCLFPPEELASFETVLHGPEAIRRYLPQRDHMLHLEGILHIDEEQGLSIGFKDVRDDEFWCSGHMPGRPILPGILMIETAAQLCTFFYIHGSNPKSGRQYGFGAVNHVKFRGVVRPGERLLFVAKARRLRRSLFRFDTQAFRGTTLVFEGEITGIELPESA